MDTAKPFSARRLQLLALLNGRLQGVSAFDEADFWQAAEEEGMVAVLWHAVCDRPLSAKAKVLASSYLRTQTAQVMRCRQVTEEVLTAANSAGISVLCLRGQALAETLYENSSLRPQSDVDMLVSAADVPEFDDALRGIGFTPTPIYPMVFERGQVLVDVHTDIIGMARIASRSKMTSLRTVEFFRHTKQGSFCGQPALILGHRVLLPYLCLHALKHSYERLIWLWDIVLLTRRIEKEQVWPEVVDGIHIYRLERPCYYALSYVRKYLNASIPEEVMQAIRPQMNWREKSLLARFMAHEPVPYMAERIFSRMMPDAASCRAFWHETIFPRLEVREQFAGDTDCPNCNFIRNRIRLLLGGVVLIWRELMALIRFSA